MLHLKTIRYMGIKAKLLDHIVRAIKDVTPDNGVVCDLMAGSNTVSYALKENYTVYSNDVQYYSFIISKAVLENKSCVISATTAINDLIQNYNNNKKMKHYTFFKDTYSNTYFSELQCEDIDSIRYAIECLENEEKKNLYMLALMCAMCKIQSTPGHFAQFMPATHKRIIPLQQMNLLEEFKNKCNDYSNLYFDKKIHKCFCSDYKDLLDSGVLDEVDTIYLDSPYTQEQYSRFYHILETVTKYDNPSVNFKARYRDDRFLSDFCYKNKVKKEFEKIICYCKNNSINLVISYSNKAVLPINELEILCKKYFSYTHVEYIDYKHSTQGKGVKQLSEVIIKCQTEI